MDTTIDQLFQLTYFNSSDNTALLLLISLVVLVLILELVLLVVAIAVKGVGLGVDYQTGHLNSEFIYW